MLKVGGSSQTYLCKSCQRFWAGANTQVTPLKPPINAVRCLLRVQESPTEMLQQRFCKHSPIILQPPLDFPCLLERSEILQKTLLDLSISEICLILYSWPEDLRCSRQHYDLYKADGEYQFQYGAVILGGHLCGAGITHYWGH